MKAESLAKRRATILARRTRNAAYHEAAHAVVALRLGFSVSSCWLSVGDGPMDGRTQYFRRSADGALTFFDLDADDAALAELAGDAAGAILDQREKPGPRSRAFHGQEILAVADRRGDASRLFREARALVEANWPDVERVAQALLDGRDLYEPDFAAMFPR